MKSRILFFAMVAVFSIAQESNANPLGIPDGQYEGSGTIIFDKPVSILKIKSVDFVATRIFKGDLIDGTTIAQTPIGKEVVEVHYRLSQDGDNHYRILDRTANNLEIGSVSCTPGVCRFEVNSAK
ncbi:MAG: hypothetical protein V4692_03895, partial [Bdellovibrionota bacterium]